MGTQISVSSVSRYRRTLREQLRIMWKDSLELQKRCSGTVRTAWTLATGSSLGIP